MTFHITKCQKSHTKISYGLMHIYVTLQSRIANYTAGFTIQNMVNINIINRKY